MRNNIMVNIEDIDKKRIYIFISCILKMSRKKITVLGFFSWVFIPIMLYQSSKLFHKLKLILKATYFR